MEDRIVKRTVAAVSIVVLLTLSVSALPADKEEHPKPAQNLSELQQQIEKILKETHTPGVSIALVHRDRPEWVTGLGKADVASGRQPPPTRCSASVRPRRRLCRCRY